MLVQISQFTVMKSFELLFSKLAIMNVTHHDLFGCAPGLNCGRWDYIFSYIKKLRNHPQFVLPDRKDVTMSSPFMAAYVRLLIRTCHKVIPCLLMSSSKFKADRFIL